MADVAARREARRKRILENSEDRIQRITGKIDYNDLKEKSNNDIDETNTQPSTSKFVNYFSANEALIENDASSALIEDINSKIQDQDRDKIPHVQMDGSNFIFQSLPHVLHKRNVIKNDEHKKSNANPHERLKPVEKVDADEITTEINGDISTSNSSRPTSSKVSLLHLILTSRTTFIVLSAILNVLFILKLDHLFGTAIMIPYFVIVLGRLYVCENLQESQNGSILIAALILCNVKPKLIYRMRGLITLFNTIFKDFALYIFSFVLIYSVVSQYWNNLDTLLFTTDAADKIKFIQQINFETTNLIDHREVYPRG